MKASAKPRNESNDFLPGNSVSETGERIKGGAVIDDKSPEKEARLGATQYSATQPNQGRKLTT
jgi:hypothetical protein